MASDLSTKDILDRMAAIEKHQSEQLLAARSENRYLTVVMLFIIAALAGIQITGFGFSARPSVTATVNMGPSEAVPVHNQSPVEPTGNTPLEEESLVDPSMVED